MENTCQSSGTLTADCGLKAALDYSYSDEESNKYISAYTQYVVVKKKLDLLIISHNTYTAYMS